jgi:DICT domain-containing protein
MLEGSILHQLKVAHQPGQVGKRPLNFGVYYKNTLVALCHALEDSILQCSSQPLVVAAFQRGKWYLQEADRYADLAERSRHIVIMATPDAGFAEHPTSQRANVDLVDLPTNDPVAQEWHLMILAPTYTAMVLCQELSPEDYGVQGVPTVDLERKFYGFWTFERNLVQETVELTIEHVRRYHPALAEQLMVQAQEIATTQPEASDDLGVVVSRVIDYLQSSEATLTTSTTSHISSNLHYDILDNNLVSNEVQAFLRMAQLMDQADTINPTAAAEVAVLAEAMGQLLDLPVWQLHRLKLAGLLHRLSPLQKSEAVLTASTTRYTEATEMSAPSCPLIPGAQVLRTMSRLRAIATIITHQTEYWDGSGQPAGLAGDEIPLESRILGLIEYFQQRLAQMRYAQAQQQIAGTPDSLSSTEMMTKVLEDCRQYQGVRWDPKLMETLSLLVCGLQQGLNLSVNLPKISAGLWLIDSHCSDNLFSSP